MTPEYKPQPLALVRQATDAASAVREIVLRTAQTIHGRHYVRVEGWMAIALAHGCTLSATDVREVQGGIAARGIVRRMSDGAIICEAEGFVGQDERVWQGRPVYARRAMAQTRAMSRAARSAFAHVVVLIDSGLSTTPAEEMADIDLEPGPGQAPSTPAQTPAPAPAPSPAPTQQAEPPKPPPIEGTQAAVLATGRQIAAEIRRIHDLCRQAGASTRGDVLAICSRVVGREVSSSTDLTAEERAKLIETLAREGHG